MSAKENTNPFQAGMHNGVQTYHCVAEDRIRSAALFDSAQCEAALKLPDLQKTVTAAVQRRQRYLGKVAAVLHFTDHGQDFLRWELDINGKVIGCEPFQGSVWNGKQVMNHRLLGAGDTVYYRTRGESTSASCIRYPLERVEYVEGGSV